MNIILLHGTLQRPKVWTQLISNIKNSELVGDIHQIICPDLYSDNPHSLEAWYDQIISQVPIDEDVVYLGYSLGGRFAVELYNRSKKLKVKGLVLVAMDPGIENNDLRQAQVLRDEAWAEKFITRDWASLMEEWNSLPVFSGIPCPHIQEESDFSRRELARIWMLTSKGNNPSLWGDLRDITCPVLLVSGGLDKKFNEFSIKMKDYISDCKHIVFERSGHRVPWEDSEGFNKVIIEFFKNKDYF